MCVCVCNRIIYSYRNSPSWSMRCGKLGKGFQKSLHWNSLSLIIQVKPASTGGGKLRLLIYRRACLLGSVSFYVSQLLVAKVLSSFNNISFKAILLIISLRRFIITRLFLKILSSPSRLQQHVKSKSSGQKWLFSDLIFLYMVMY